MSEDAKPVEMSEFMREFWMSELRIAEAHVANIRRILCLGKAS